MNKQSGNAELIVIFVLLAVAAVGVYFLIEENKQWQEFKIEHNCKVVGKVSGDIINTVSVGANGQMQTGMISTPSKTGWACDDGITYWR